MPNNMHERSSIVKRNLRLSRRAAEPYHYATNFVVVAEKGAESVTVGVGALCESGNCVILGSDTRASYEKAFRLNPNDRTSKIYDLPHGCFAIVAGTLSTCHGVSSQLATEFAALDEQSKLDHFREAVNRARFYEYKLIAGDRIHATFGISLYDWHRLRLDFANSAVYRGGKAIFRMLPLEVEIIVAGFRPIKPEEMPPGSGSSAIFFRAIGKHNIELENNFATIGSGGNKARQVLDKRGQNIHRSWQCTAIDVIEAMHAARRADRRHVGMPNDLFVIWQGRFRRLPSEATFVKTLLARTKRLKISHLDRFDPKTNAILESLLSDQPI